MDEDAVFKLIDKRMDILKEHILRGRTSDYAGYRSLSGAYVELEALREDIQHYLRALDQDPVDEGQ
jgi:hypothetical protein